jgi:hypothetical protein
MKGYTGTVSGQRLGKYILTSTDTNATVEELCFLCGPCRDVIITETCEERTETRVETGSNISTVALQVIGGEEKKSFISETVKYGRESQGTRTRERQGWQEPAACTKDIRPLVRDGVPQKQDRNCQTVINIWS